MGSRIPEAVNGTGGKRQRTAGNDIKKAVPGRYQARRDIFCILLEFQKDTGDFLSITEAPQSP
jgi:hypothetical protein